MIVLEGLDGSGKQTQTNILKLKLELNNYKVIKLSFPNYESESSAPIKMYLNGELGNSLSDISAFASSSFYAVDRYINYMIYWKKYYKNENNIIICNRYTTSNIIYQMAKLNKNEWNNFIDWIIDYEYVKIGIPEPDFVIYLDMDILISSNLLKIRYCGDETKKDIHESDLIFLEKCRECAYFSAKKLGWKILECNDKNNNIYSKEYISEKILEILKVII